MTGPEFVYPEQTDRETGAEYFARVHAMGLPYPWERDKAVPPGPITVTREWSLRDPSSTLGPLLEGNFVASKRDVDMMREVHPEYIPVRRTRWVAVGDWEDVPVERPDCSCPDNTFDRACPFHGDTDHRVGDPDA